MQLYQILHKENTVEQWLSSHEWEHRIDVYEDSFNTSSNLVVCTQRTQYILKHESLYIQNWIVFNKISD